MRKPIQPHPVNLKAYDLAGLPGLVVAADAGDRILYCNEALCEKLGHDKETLTGMTFKEIIDAGSRARYESLDREVATSALSGRFLCKDSGRLPFRGGVRFSLSSELAMTGVFFEEEEEDLPKEVCDNHRVLIENSRDIIFKISREGRFIFVSPAWEKMLGYSVASIVGKSYEDFLHPEDLSRCRDVFYRAFETGKTEEMIEYRVKNASGQWRWHSARVTPIVDKDRAINSIMGIASDITEARMAQEKARSFQDLMRYVIEYSRGAVAVHDRDLNYLYVSRSYLESYRAKEEEVIGRHHYEVFPDLPQKWRKIHQLALKGVVSSAEEDPFVREDGTVDWTRWECRPWYESTGRIGGIIIYTEVINHQKEIERMIYNERERFKTTLLSVGDGVISTDEKGRIVMMNPAAAQLTGWGQDEAVGELLEKVFCIDYQDQEVLPVNLVEEVMALGRILELEESAVLVTKSGQRIPIEDSVAPIKDTFGNINGVVVVFRDFSEKIEKINEIKYLSLHDHLTGLYNRRYMEDSLERLDQVRNLPFTIMVMDVNGLKLTNDAFGHEMGDELLKAVAGMLKNELRGGEILGRAGGDEFNILLPGIGEDEAKRIKDRILKATAKIKLDSVMVSLAVGHATKTAPEQDIKSVFTLADNRMYKDKLRYGKIMRSRTIEMVLRNIHLKYDSEQIHNERVSEYCEAIAKAMAFDDAGVKNIKTAGVLHDIGKIMVPPEILNKPGPLTPEEFEVIKRHPETSYQILRSVDDYAVFSEDVLYHHERIDGGGYPEGLKGEQIPLNARIIAVADAYEAMTADRPYQVTLTKEEAIQELEKHAGTQFDTEVVRIFVDKVLR